MATKNLNLRNKTLGVVVFGGNVIAPGKILTVTPEEGEKLQRDIMRGTFEAVDDKAAEKEAADAAALEAEAAKQREAAVAKKK